MPTAPWWRCCGRCPRKRAEGNASGESTPAKLRALIEIGQTLLIQPVCPLCRHTLPNAGLSLGLCPACRDNLGLSSTGYRGLHPLPWWALGNYDGALRCCLLKLKRTHCERVLNALLNNLKPLLPETEGEGLVPIPGWKRRRGNLLPLRMAAGLGNVQRDLLQRSQAGIGQHHLNRRQRLINLKGAFQSPPSNQPQKLWLVDDIFTTGATALAAQTALTKAGHHVRGLICLARTPNHRPRR